MARWADLEIIDEDFPLAVRVKPGWDIPPPRGIGPRLPCSIAAEVQNSCVEMEDHTSRDEKTSECCEQPRQISKCVLRSVYTAASPLISFLDHAMLCSYHVEINAPLRKAQRGERPVPPSVWKGAGPFTQKAMLRHFRGLGWGPHSGLGTKCGRLRRRDRTRNATCVVETVVQKGHKKDDPTDTVALVPELCDDGQCGKCAGGDDSADVEEQDNYKLLVRCFMFMEVYSIMKRLSYSSKCHFQNIRTCLPASCHRKRECFLITLGAPGRSSFCVKRLRPQPCDLSQTIAGVRSQPN